MSGHRMASGGLGSVLETRSGAGDGSVLLDSRLSVSVNTPAFLRDVQCMQRCAVHEGEANQFMTIPVFAFKHPASSAKH
jgi:hypothetical protein